MHPMLDNQEGRQYHYIIPLEASKQREVAYNQKVLIWCSHVPHQTALCQVDRLSAFQVGHYPATQWYRQVSCEQLKTSLTARDVIIIVARLIAEYRTS